MYLARRFANASTALTLLGALAGCGGSEPAPQTPATSASSDAPAASAAPVAPASSAAPAPSGSALAPAAALPPVEFATGTPADSPAKMPVLAISAPTAEQEIAADKAADTAVKLVIKSWDTQTGGPHVHLILDGRPYKPIYDLKQPVKLGDLVPAGVALAEGEHTLVAFPSRMTHESVKGIGALVVRHFWVGKKGTTSFKPTDPLLVYSRPKGTYNGSKADHVLVDFYVSNVELGSAHSVRATLKGPGLGEAGKQVEVKSWGPLYADHLPSGDYSISLELLDKEGRAVPSTLRGEWNSVTRSFTVNREAPDDAPPAAKPGEGKGADAKGHEAMHGEEHAAKPAAAPAAGKPGDEKHGDAKHAGAKPAKKK